MLVIMGFMSWYRRRISRTQPHATPANAMAQAEAGNAEAQFGLGLKCCTENGVAQDLEQAARWYRKAADQGHALAQFNLAMMFTRGQGVTQDGAAALIWTRKAAEGGDAGAQFDLGSRYHRKSVDRAGMDCDESRVEAYKWLHLAAAQGYRGSAAACERLTLGMTLEEVTDGNRRTAAFVIREPAPPSTPSFPQKPE